MEIFQVTLLFGILIILLIAGIQISFAMGIAGIIGIIIFIAPTQLNQIPNIFFNHGTSGTLLVAPMFILMAEIIIATGIAKDLYDSVYKWFSRVPGSLAVTSVFASAGFSSVSGSSPATVAIVGGISTPEMLKRRYSRKLSAGAVVTGGTLGILIPPSMALIIYGIITETSIVKLFLAGIVPGIILTILLSLSIMIYALFRPESSPKGESFSWKERIVSLVKIVPVMTLALVIIISMYSGMATPTEAAGVGVVVAIIIGLIMRRLTWEGLKQSLYNSAKTSSMVLFLILGGLIFSFIVTYLGLSDIMMNFIMQFDLNKWLILAILLIILLILGMFLDPISMLMLTMPFMFPMVVELGFHPIWFGIIVTIALEIGMITPPVGLNLFVLKGSIPELDLVEDIVKGALPFVAILILFIIILCIFPGLTTVLI